MHLDIYNHSEIRKIHEIARVFQDIPVMPPHHLLLSDAHIMKKRRFNVVGWACDHEVTNVKKSYFQSYWPAV